MTIEEAIKTAIELEAEVRDLYRRAVRRTGDPAGKRIYGVLAEEEQDHLDYLKTKLNEWKGAGTVTAERLDTAIPPGGVLTEGVGKLEANRKGKEKGGELQMLTRALRVEVKTSAFYREMARELEQAGRELFAPFVVIEEGHVALLRAEIDYLTKTGYWFDFKEFDME